MTCFLLLLKKQSIETIRSGFLSHKYEYKLNYTVGQKTIDGVGFSTSTFDLSKADGGLALDGGYTLNGDKTLDVNQMQFLNPDNVNSTNTYTLLDWSKVTGDGTFSVTNGGTGAKTATTTSAEYTVQPATNGVTAFGTKELTFQVDDTRKQINVSASDPSVSKIKLGTFDVTKDAQEVENLVNQGTIDTSGLSIKGFSSLADAANFYNKNLILAKASGDTTFANWTGYSTEAKDYKIYDNGKGITGTLSGTVKADDNGNIAFASDGLQTIAYKELGWDYSGKPSVTLDGGKLGSVDFSNIYTWWTLLKWNTETMHLLDAKNLSEGNIKLVPGSSWTPYTVKSGDTTITAYHSSLVKKSNQTVSDAGMTLSYKMADQVIATETKKTDSEGKNKYDFSVDFTTNKLIATDFTIEKINWTNGGTGLKLKESYDFTELADGKISFDASDPYALIANPDQVNIGDTMTFFDAGEYMTKAEWDTKVAVTPSGSAKNYSAQHGAVTVEGSVDLNIKKDDVNQKVIASVSDEYLSGVTIDLSQLGTGKTTEASNWENGKELYRIDMDYNDDKTKQTTTVTVSGPTHESVKTGESMTLLHIEGKNAGAEGNITAFDTTKDVAFSDTATNGMVATGTHTDTLKSNVSEDKSTYDLVYSVGKKTITEFKTNNLDLTADAFTAGDQYMIGDKDFTVNVNDIVIGKTGDGKEKAIIDFSDDKVNFKLSGDTVTVDGKQAKSNITYTETDAEAVNGVKASGNQDRTFSTDGKVIYLNSVEKDTSGVTIGAVDLSKEARSFNDLTDKGTIDATGASYVYSDKKIAEVTGQNLKVVGATGANNFNSEDWKGLPTDETTISVNQEKGISAVVKAAYNTSDGNINLETNSGFQSLTFGEGITWSTADTAAVSLSGQDVEAVDFSAISFADTEMKKDETMHLLNAQGMSKETVSATAPSASEGWTKRTGETGTTYYDKDADKRTHDDADDLKGYGMTLTVDRGDRITEKTETVDGKTNYTLDYTRGQGYVTGMTGDILWTKGETAITLDKDYDFSALSEAIVFKGSQISNMDKMSAGDTMTFFDANGHMSASDWANKVSVSDVSQSKETYNETKKAVTVKGSAKLEITKTDGKDNNMKVNAQVTDSHLSDITVDLAKIGKEETTEKTKWENDGTIYSNTENKQDYGGTTIHVAGNLFGGETDETVQTGDKMTLVHIEGTNAGSAKMVTEYFDRSTNAAFSYMPTVNFRDTTETGIITTGTHRDTLTATLSAAKNTYDLTYTIGKKIITGVAGGSVDLSKVPSAANETNVARNALMVADNEDDTEYTLSGKILIDVDTIKITDIGDGTKKDLLDFRNDTSDGYFEIADADENGSKYSEVSYSEEEATNGIWAAGTQYRTFSVSNKGKTFSLDSASQDVDQVTIGIVDVSEPIRSFDNLVEEGTVTLVDGVMLNNLALTKDTGKNFTIAEATGTYNFSKWTLPEGTPDIYAIQEQGVYGTMEGKFNTEDGNLKVEMTGIKSITFADGVKWRVGEAVLDFTGSKVDFTGKTIDATKLSFDADSVKSIATTDGTYQMVLIHTDGSNNLDKADIKNNDSIDMTIADTITFKGETKLSADKKQFVADMWKGTGTATDAAHRHVMAQAAAMQAITGGNVETTDSISRALAHYRDDEEGSGSMIFASIGGSKTRTETGSHISQNTWNVNAGVGTRKDLSNGAHTEYGLYYEGGTGNYSTYGVGEGIARTSGDLTHHGAGFLFRYESKNAVYGEAGFHAGRIKNENKALGLDDSATYYGFHLGVGKIIQIGDTDSWDVYTKFYLNHTGGLDYKNSAITEIGLDSVTSKLLRIGGRYNHQVQNNWSFYTGAAFAYEFGGNAHGTAGIINGDFDSIRTATTKGGGALLELGFRKESTNDNPWEIDLGIKGYMGRQKGIGGNIGINYHF